MKKLVLSLTVATAALLGTAGNGFAAGDAPHIAQQNWSFGGVFGRFDRAQIQRGYQVYKEVCASCHGLKRISFRNLAEKGGPEFPEESVKALAATFEIQDGPNDQGKMFKRPGKLSDAIPSPFANEQEARAAQNGAYPPDLSLITKARNTENQGAFYIHPFQMLRDVVTGYQEGGANYVYALLTGYKPAPSDMKLAEGMHYNAAFPGHQIAMVAPLSDGLIKYQDGSPATLDQYAKDVTAFLAWAGDPKLEERKRIGLMALIYLLITAVLLYFAKKRIWSRAH